MIGRCGNKCRNSAARNGCAPWLMPKDGNTPPCSRRCCRDCTAGVCKTRANNVLAAKTWESCAKRRKGRSPPSARQGGGFTRQLAPCQSSAADLVCVRADGAACQRVSDWVLQLRA